LFLEIVWLWTYLIIILILIWTFYLSIVINSQSTQIKKLN
jgi:hypothetical protein